MVGAGDPPTLARRYLACAYAPMIELLRYLEANGFTTYIASGPTMSTRSGFSQTAINQRAGAATQLSELVTVVLAVACALSSAAC